MTDAEMLETWKAWARTYYNHPAAFVRDVLAAEVEMGGPMHPWQVDALNAVARGDRNIAIASGHRVGKSTFLAWVCLWYMTTRPVFKIGVTAPTSGQLEGAFYAELKRWYAILAEKVPAIAALLEVKSDTIDLKASKGGSFLVIKTGRADQPEALAGLHSENTLLIGDEASGIAETVFEAATSSMAAESAQMLLCGNPLRNTGYFYKCFHDWKARWTCFKVNSRDIPSVSRAWIAEKRDEYGEESNQFRARVEGEFPRGDDDTIIPLEMVLSAVGREILPLSGEREVWGLDVAEKGTNDSALCRRQGKVVVAPVERFNGLETMQLVGRVHAIYAALPEHKRPIEVNVDANGIGAGVASRLQELGLPVNCINVAEVPAVGGGDKVFFNLRTELWYKGREFFQGRDCSIPKDERLIADLTKIRLAQNEGGRADLLKAESKLAMRKRGVKSPDTGDAFILTFAGVAGTAMGQSFQKYRNKPVKRRIKGASFV